MPSHAAIIEQLTRYFTISIEYKHGIPTTSKHLNRFTIANVSPAGYDPYSFIMMTMNLKFTHLLISKLDGFCNVCSVFSLLFRPEELSKSTFKKMPKASNLFNDCHRRKKNTNC